MAKFNEETATEADATADAVAPVYEEDPASQKPVYTAIMIFGVPFYVSSGSWMVETSEVPGDPNLVYRPGDERSAHP